MRVLASALRHLVGSDAVIAAAIFMHFAEGTIFLTTRAADGTIGMAALLATFRLPVVAAGVMFTGATLAGIGLWVPRLTFDVRLTLMMLQFALLTITGLGAFYAVLHHSYADGVPRAWQFIACDQFARMGAAPLYLLAIYARSKRAGE